MLCNSVRAVFVGVLFTETVFFLTEFRQASERQELACKSTCTMVTCPEPEFADPDFEFPFVHGLGTGLLAALALAVIFPCLCSFRVDLVTLRVRRVRLNHSEDVRTEGSRRCSVQNLRSSCRVQVSAGSFLREKLVVIQGWFGRIWTKWVVWRRFAVWLAAMSCEIGASH